MKDQIKMTVSEEVTLQQVLQSDLEPIHNLQQAQEHNQDLDDPFADYMWMENEEEFNRQVEEQLREEDFIERCFQEMFEEEERDCFVPSRDLPALAAGSLSAVDAGENQSFNSALNPNAKEFTPGMPQHSM